MTLRLSFKASRPLPAASVVADTYLRQAGAGWPACCEHVEVMLPGGFLHHGLVAWKAPTPLGSRNGGDQQAENGIVDLA